jgi:small GTP-binding protein
MNQHFFFKILVAGPGGAGKTSLLRQYIKNTFDNSTKMTIGVDFYLKELEFDSGVQVSLQLWDFGGQEHFQGLHGDYVEGAKGALLLIDLTQFFMVKKVQKWVELVRSERDDLPIVFIGNKVDLQDKIMIGDEVLEEMMEKYNLSTCLKTSAKTGRNVDEAFEKIAELVYNHKVE